MEDLQIDQQTKCVQKSSLKLSFLASSYTMIFCTSTINISKYLKVHVIYDQSTFQQTLTVNAHILPFINLLNNGIHLSLIILNLLNPFPFTYTLH